VKFDVLESVLDHIRRFLEVADVGHRLIVSGTGDWRFLDLVPINGGKREALEYARQKLGFPSERTVACGDSGNDKDMLEGDHHAVVVGNAQPDLMAWASTSRVQRDVTNKKGSGMNGSLVIVEGHKARGILEGLEKLGFR